MIEHDPTTHLPDASRPPRVSGASLAGSGSGRQIEQPFAAKGAAKGAAKMGAMKDADSRSLAAHNDFITDGARSGVPGITGKVERIAELQRLRNVRGRAANTNPSGRFEPISRHVFDDGWQTIDELPPFKTEVYEEKPKTIITRKTLRRTFPLTVRSTPIGAANMAASTVLRGRPMPIWGFLRGWISNPSSLPRAMRRGCWRPNCRKRAIEPKTIAIGTNTDPYQPIEKSAASCAKFSKCWKQANHPVGIVTKSALVTRDIDILSRMAAKGLVKVALSITTLDRKLARAMEPRAATPALRLKAISDLAEAGIPTSVMVAPVIPALTDHEIGAHSGFGAGAGASEAGYILLRLPRRSARCFATGCCSIIRTATAM